MRRAPRASSSDSAPHEPSRLVAAALLVCVVSIGLGACGDSTHAPQAWPMDASGASDPAEAGDTDMPGAFTLELPPWQEEDVFPCSECHNGEDVPLNSERRTLEMAHEHIVLKHDEKHRWCLDCHDEQNRDKLRLASGTLIDFEESHRLCGQCHGDKHRDWRAGIHGRRTGRWDGKKEYLLCVHCHWAHAPQWKPIEPLPAPIPPEATR